MQRFHLGSIPVARIGFGTMQLPGPGVFGPPQDRERALGCCGEHYRSLSAATSVASGG